MRSFLLGLLLGTLGPILFDRLRYRLKAEPAENRSRGAATSEAERPIEQPGAGEGQARVDLAELTAAELYRRAQAADIAGRSGMSKAQLIAASKPSTASSAKRAGRGLLRPNPSRHRPRLYLEVSRASFASSFRLCSSYSVGVIASDSRSSASFLSWSSGSVGGCDDSATPPATLDVTPIRRKKSPIASLVFLTTSTVGTP
jgi:hypothetical protein